MENMEVYEKYRTVPQDACKPFDNGTFKGTDINSMWRIKCLTEQFGMVGFGWTVRVVRTWTEKSEEGDVLAFAEIAMKVKVDGVWSEEWFATGGNKLVKWNRNKEYFTASDEAFKMAITDAFGVACKYLGFGADVYWANDKSKYTEEQVKMITPAQIEKFKELNMNIDNVCKYFGVSCVEQLTEAQAEASIRRKMKG